MMFKVLKMRPSEALLNRIANRAAGLLKESERRR
jgi:hypothetical protein